MQGCWTCDQQSKIKVFLLYAGNKKFENFKNSILNGIKIFKILPTNLVSLIYRENHKTGHIDFEML